MTSFATLRASMWWASLPSVMSEHLPSSSSQWRSFRARQTHQRQRSPVSQPVPAVRGQLWHRQRRGEHLGQLEGPAVHRHLPVRGPQRQPGDNQRYRPRAWPWSQSSSLERPLVASGQNVWKLGLLCCLSHAAFPLAGFTRA